jgi:Uracil DNA glycosylase superfamily
MTHPFDPGYTGKFRALCEDYPSAETYPAAAFRTEWGPVFHRGRLDGSARVLVIGQDPAQHETIARRILVGEAGHRLQGFLARLGVDRSYVMINTFLYSVYGQGGGTKHQNDAGIIAYRNRWLDALMSGSHIELAVSLGELADNAWKTWKATASGAAVNPAHARITHPTQPESSSKGNPAKHATAIREMLQNWNGALQTLKPSLTHPDSPRALTLYGDAFQASDLVEIPEADLPAGSPLWMLGAANWATRTGSTAPVKRATITVTVPKAFRQ